MNGARFAQRRDGARAADVQPLDRLADDLDTRSERDLSEIRDTDNSKFPAEIVAFLVANWSAPT
jgi:hypothetical protein